jgi:hypothetical protein
MRCVQTAGSGRPISPWFSVSSVLSFSEFNAAEHHGEHWSSLSYQLSRRLHSDQGVNVGYQPPAFPGI